MARASCEHWYANCPDAPVCAATVTLAGHPASKMVQVRLTPTLGNGRRPRRTKTALFRANPRLIRAPNDSRAATSNTCSLAALLLQLPPRRGGSQAAFASAHERHDLTNDRMHSMHKTHNGIDHYARLTHSREAVCDPIVAAQENAPHMHNRLGSPPLATRQRSANPLLSPLASPVTNSPFRDCSLMVAEPRRSPMRTV